MRRFARKQLSILAVPALVVAMLACTSPADGRATGTAPPSTSAPRAARAGSGAATHDNWVTYHYGPARHGFDPAAQQASGHLSTAWTTKLDGAVYGEPLVVFGKVIVATENDTIYALSLGGKVLWKRHVGTPVPLSALPCGNIDPLGITGTPSYGAGTHQIYFAAELDHPIRHRLFAVSAATGQVSWSRSVDPASMDAQATQERGALAIAQGRVWVPFGGLAGDCGPYHGWVIGSPLSGSGPLSVYKQPSAREAGIWAPSGPAVDVSGHLYVAVGNGASVAPPYDDSDSVLKLDGNRKISLFAPTNWAAENAADKDLGSTGPLLFNALGQHWVFADGKAGDGYLLHQEDLGGIGGAAASINGCASWSGMAFNDGLIYIPCSSGLSAYRVVAGPAVQRVWTNGTIQYGAAPVVGGGAVWAAYNGRLYQVNPTTGSIVTSISIGACPCPHFVTPTLHSNLVFVGTQTGVVALRTS